MKPPKQLERVKAEVLRRAKEAGPKRKITPELRLAREMGVSHSTARRALRALEEEGFVYRRQGSGTYATDLVAAPNGDADVFAGISLRDFFEEDGGPATTTDQPGDGARTRLLGPAEDGDLYRSLIARYRQNAPAAPIGDFEPRGHNLFYPDYFPEIEKGFIPDLFHVHQRHLYWLIRNGYILPLDRYLTAAPVFPLQSLDPAAVRAATWRDKIWMLPKSSGAYHALFNKTLFEQAGIPFPDTGWTWKDYLEIAWALTRTSGDKSVYGCSPHRDFFYLLIVVWAFGGELVSEDGRPRLTDPTTREAIRFAVDLTLKHKVTPPPSSWRFWHSDGRVADQLELFASNRLGMYICPETALPRIKNVAFGVAPLPLGPAGRFSPCRYDGWVMGRTVRDADSVARLMKYLATEGAPEFARRAAPAFISGQTLKNFVRAFPNDDGFEALAARNVVRALPFNGFFWPCLNGHFHRMLTDLYFDGRDFDAALTDADARLQQAATRFLRWEQP